MRPRAWRMRSRTVFQQSPGSFLKGQQHTFAHKETDLFGMYFIFGIAHPSHEEHMVLVLFQFGTLVNIEHIFPLPAMQLEQLTVILDCLRAAQACDIDPNGGPVLEQRFQLFDGMNFGLGNGRRTIRNDSNLRGLGIRIGDDGAGWSARVLRRRGSAIYVDGE